MKKFTGILLTMVMVLSMAVSATAEFNFSDDITVVSREDGSGTRGAFIELMGIEKKDESGEKYDYTSEEAIITNNTNVMMTTVAGNDVAIGYCSLGSLNDGIKALQVEGVSASVDNIKDNSYKVARPFNLATIGEVSEVAQDFIAYMMSAEGQEIVSNNGYIASESTPYAGKQVSGKIVVSGSSSVSPVMEKLKEAYLVINPSASIEIQTSDSTTGMSNAKAGLCDIGMASRTLKQSELDAGLQPQVLAMDGIAIIVNNENPLVSLTAEQIAQIFMGEVLTWEAFQ